MAKKKRKNITSVVNSDIFRIGKYLNETVSVTDAAGNIVSRTVKPLMVELYARDVLQQIIGATLLAVPLAYTEEVWKLGEELPAINVYMVSVTSILFISTFVYYNFYSHKHIAKHWLEFIKRVLSVYVVSLVVSFIILTLIDRAPLDADLFWSITIKRMVLISLPASMSAAIADVIK